MICSIFKRDLRHHLNVELLDIWWIRIIC